MSKNDLRDFAYEYPRQTSKPGVICSELPGSMCYFRYDELFKTGGGIRYLPAVETGAYASGNEITVIDAGSAFRNVFGDL